MASMYPLPSKFYQLVLLFWLIVFILVVTNVSSKPEEPVRAGINREGLGCGHEDRYACMSCSLL